MNLLPDHYNILSIEYYLMHSSKIYHKPLQYCQMREYWQFISKILTIRILSWKRQDKRYVLLVQFIFKHLNYYISLINFTWGTYRSSIVDSWILILLLKICYKFHRSTNLIWKYLLVDYYLDLWVFFSQNLQAYLLKRNQFWLVLYWMTFQIHEAYCWKINPLEQSISL